MIQLAARNRTRSRSSLTIPREVMHIVGTAAAIFVVVAAGSAASDWLGGSVWGSAVAYLVPAAVVFALYCWVVRRL